MAVVAAANETKPLPLRALIACTARCARRVQYLFHVDPSRPEAEACATAIDMAIRLSEEWAAGRDLAVNDVAQATEYTLQTLAVVSEEHGEDKGPAFAANAAYAVIDATKSALEAMEADDPLPAAERVIDSVAICTDAAISADPEIRRAAQLDWDMASRLHLGRFPDLGDPVDPSETGILGPLRMKTSSSGKKAGKKTASRKKTGVSGGKSNKQPPGESPETEVQDADAGLIAQQEELKSAQLALRSDREIFEAQLEEFRAEQEAFQRDRETLESARQQLEELNASAGEVIDLEHLRAEVQLEQEVLVGQKESLAKAQEQLHSDRTQLEAEGQRLTSRQNELEDERSELKSVLEELREEQQRLAERESNLETAESEMETRARELQQFSAEFERERKQFEEQKQQWETDNQPAESDSEHLRALSDQFQEEYAAFEAERARFAEEKKQLAAKEVELRKKVQQLRQEWEKNARAEDAPGADSVAELAELQSQIAELNQERSQLKADNSRLVQEISQLRVTDVSGADTKTSDRTEVGETFDLSAEVSPLRILLQPGSATSAHIAALLQECSTLYRKMGGPGVQFLVSDCKSRHILGSQGGDHGESDADSALVEIHAIPRRFNQRIDSGTVCSQWDRFTSCLQMAVKLDAGLGDEFDLGERAAASHPCRKAATEAIEIALSSEPTQEQDPSTASTGLPIDAVNHHLQRIEKILRVLERQFGALAELTPMTNVSEEQPADDAHPTEEPSKRPWYRRLRAAK